MGCVKYNFGEFKKKVNPTTRALTTPLFLLRCTQMGLSMSDLDRLDMGIILDMLTESINDNYDYPVKATQADFDRF